MANKTRLSFSSIDAGRKFVAGRIVNAFGFSHRLLEHFNDRPMESVPPCFGEAGTSLPKVDARPKKRFRGINIADPRYMTLIEQK